MLFVTMSLQFLNIAGLGANVELVCIKFHGGSSRPLLQTVLFQLGDLSLATQPWLNALELRAGKFTKILNL